jgi:hypothetical protein
MIALIDLSMNREIQSLRGHFVSNAPDAANVTLRKTYVRKMLSSITLLAQLECQVGAETLARCNQLIEIAERRIADL